MDSPAIGDEAFDELAPKKRRPKPEPETTDETDVDDGTGAADDAGAIETPTAAEPEATDDTVPEPKPLPDRPERNLPNADDLARQASKAVSRSRGPKRRDRKPIGARPQRVEDPAVVLKRLVDPARAKSLLRKLNDAGGAFGAERFSDARASLRPVVKEAPDLPDGRELMGLTLYRMGKWREAIDQLEVFREQTHSTEQHPVLMDCHRALERWADVDELWTELGDASPSGELVTEGRIVVAGMHADRGDLGGAIRMLESGWKLPKRPGGHHLRRAYALADAYERVGKAARARELFKWIAGKDPHFSDVRSRVKTLS